MWCKFLCFSTAFQNGSACKFLCPATLHFSDKSVHKFLNVFAFSNRITTNVVSNLWCKLPCFCNCDSKEKCVQIFVPCNVELFQQECSQVFERVYFLQPYYDKRCCKIVVQVAVFFQQRFKRKVRANFFALQRCTFPARGLASF